MKCPVLVLTTAVPQLIFKPQQSSRCKLHQALTLLVNSKIVQRCSVNVHTGKCTSGEGHVVGRPKNENFSATINTKSHDLDNCSCTETWFRVTIKTYKAILSGGYQHFYSTVLRPQINRWPSLAQYLRTEPEISSTMLHTALNFLSRLYVWGHSLARNLLDWICLDVECCVRAP